MRRLACTLVLVVAAPMLRASSAEAQSHALMVIDSAAIASSGARTLADLLAARVPGMSVSYLTGAPGIAAQVSSRSSVGFSGSGRPALIVDGVLLRDEQLWISSEPDGQQLADHWNLPVEEIVKVEVVLGASDGMALELGASRGAVLVTTHRPRGGAWSAQTFVDVRSVGAGPAIRSATTRTGDLTAGGTTYYCTLQAEAAGDCTPTGTWTDNPFPGGSPFQTSQLVRGGISAAGGLPFGLQGRVAVASASEPGALGSAIARHDAALALTLPKVGRLSSSADARLQQLDGDRIEYSMLRRYATFGPYDADSSLDPMVTEDFARDVAPAWDSKRSSISSRTQFDLSPSTALALQLGGERLSRSSYSSNRTETGPWAGLNIAELASQRTTWAAALSARNTRSTARGELVTELSITRTRSVQDDLVDYNVIPDTSAPISASNRTKADARTSTQVLSVRWLDKAGVGVGAGLRREGFENGESMMLPFADATWDWSPLRAGAIARINVRAAYGEAVDVQSGLDATMRGVFVPVGPSHGEIGPERTSERQLGAELHLHEGAVMLFGRVFDRRVEDAVVFGPSFGFDPYRLMAGGDIRTIGGEVGVHVRRQVGALGKLSSTFWVARATGEYGDLSTAYQTFVQLPALNLRMPIAPRGRVGEVRNDRRAFSDTNLDGVIVNSELGDWEFAQSGSIVPTTTMGATVSISRGPLSIGTTLDGKFGHVRAADDGHCVWNRCDARYNPTTSLRDQADAISSFQSLVNGDFIRMRELWLSWRGDVGRIGDIELSLVAQHLLTWAASNSDDPESGAPYAAGLNLGQYQQPVAPTLGVRVKIGAPSPR